MDQNSDSQPLPIPAAEDIQPHADILRRALCQLGDALEPQVLDKLLASIRLIRLNVGACLYRQGDPGSSMHIVLTGRLRVEVQPERGPSQVLAHPQPGEIVGEMAWLINAPRAATVHAVRDTTLGVLQHENLDQLLSDHPEVFARIARMIITRLNGSQRRRHPQPGQHPGVRTVMLVPLHPAVACEHFAQGLRQALLRFGSVLQLDSPGAAARLQQTSEAHYGRFLDDCERRYDYVVLVADPQPSAWTRQCYGYADKILLIADAANPPEPTRLERWLFDEQARLHGSAYADIELVLLHRDAALPRHTRHWLAERQVRRHHHLRLHDQADLGRLARALSGNSISLVLAGGGARGFAHLGVIRALHEAGIPIDSVGGTSFGALAATGLARALCDEEIIEEQRIAFTYDDPLGDYTLPLISLVRGERLEQVLQKYLPMDIEDLWLPFFAVSSDLTTNRCRVHDRGPLWRAIRASVSLPAILPPTLEDGHLLIDGGVLNNLPIDIMRERSHGHLIAVDLAAGNEYRFSGERVPSAFDYLKTLLLPGRQAATDASTAVPAAPTVSQIIMRLTTLASRRELENIHQLADLYLNPRLDAYDFMDWDKLREIVELGYVYAQPRVQAWAAEHPQLVDTSDLAMAWLRGCRWQAGPQEAHHAPA